MTRLGRSDDAGRCRRGRSRWPVRGGRRASRQRLARGRRDRRRGRRRSPDSPSGRRGRAIGAAGGADRPATSSTCSTRTPPAGGPTASTDRLGRVDGLVHLVGGWRGGTTLHRDRPRRLGLAGRAADPHASSTRSLAFHDALLRSPRRPRSSSFSRPAPTRPTAGNAAYAAAKAAAEAWTLALADSFRKLRATRPPRRPSILVVKALVHDAMRAEQARRRSSRASPTSTTWPTPIVGALGPARRRSERKAPVADAATVTDAPHAATIRPQLARLRQRQLRRRAPRGARRPRPRQRRPPGRLRRGRLHRAPPGGLPRPLRRPRAEAFPVFNGTGANVVALQALTERWGAVICAESAHINVDECGAPEKVGGLKLLPCRPPTASSRPS